MIPEARIPVEVSRDPGDGGVVGEIPDKENAVTKGEASMAWGKIYLIKLGREDEIKACADNYSKYYNLAMNQKHADNHENHSYMELMSPASKAHLSKVTSVDKIMGSFEF